MDRSQQKEQFSIAYVRAVASVAGYATYQPTVDEDSIDIGVAARGLQQPFRSPRLELQLKCTAKETWRDDKLAYRLKAKNYEDLRGTNLLVPRLLVVVVVPPRPEEWLSQDNKELTLRKCGYWLSLRQKPVLDGQTSVTLYLPRQQIFSVEQLTMMMNSIARGLAP